MRAKSTPVVERSADSLLGVVLSCLVGLLLTVRMLVPAESAEDGGTLWIVQLWLAAGLLWAWNEIREGADHIHGGRIRWGRIDSAFLVVVVGHVISAIAVLLGEGQKRAAINLTWEWVGLGVCFFLLRQTLRSGAMARRLVGMMIIVSVSLAALGLWQHYVFYPAIQNGYSQKQADLLRLSELPPPTSNSEGYRRVKKIRELQRWMLEFGIPQDETTRMLFVARLQSSEPFGMFALANTFAGMLLVWFLAAIGIIASLWKARPGWRKLAVPLVATGLIGFCLILTKSRTAWVGLLAGLGVWGFIRLWAAGGRQTKWLRLVCAGCLVLALMVAVAAVSGGFDLEVISEAPKSLSYRLQYWSGTWEVLSERPLLGTGPGNFRQHYLRHKLPASSEEIADPHNFVLDLWANGGLLALVGFLAFLYFALRTPFSLPGNPPETSPDVGGGIVTRTGLWSPMTVGSLLAFLAVFAVSFLAGDGLDYRLPVMLAVAIGLLIVCGQFSNDRGVCSVCLLAGMVGLAMHLLGAGGIEMPAIVQIFLLIAASATVWRDEDSPHTESQDQSSPKFMVVFGFFGVLFMACLLTATAPVLNRRALVAVGDAAIIDGNGAAKAIRQYGDAAVADTFSPIPPQRLAELFFARWSALPGDAERDFNRAVQFQQISIELDPHNAGRYHTLGKWYRARYDRTKNDSDLRAAIAALRNAVARYPNNAAIRADLALTLGLAGETNAAAAEAKAALRQDEINRKAGHRDKRLSSQTVNALQEFSREPLDVPPQN